MKLYLFNPDADLALANHTEDYIPPASVRQMATDLSLLPIWFADAGSIVLTSENECNNAYFNAIKKTFLLPVDLITPSNLPVSSSLTTVEPWGWNLAQRKSLLRYGIGKNILPSIEDIQSYRELSSKATSISVLDAFSGFSHCCGEASLLATLEECRAYASDKNDCLFKSPWSSSGKGLWWCQYGYDEATNNWCRRILKEQGGVLASPIYDVCQDFAMEFYSDGCGHLSFIGYSLFETSRKGAYLGNTLLADEEIKQIIEHYFYSGFLDAVCEHLIGKLTSVYSTRYIGYLGVDMMVCKGNQREYFMLHPCVEVNLRMNMGLLSHHFTKHFLAPGVKATFSITYHSQPQKLKEMVEEYSHKYPIVVENGKLKHGFLSLTPITPQSHYLASVVTNHENLDGEIAL